MLSLKLPIATLVFVGLATSNGLGEDQIVKPVKEWSGKAFVEALEKEAPKSGFIASEKAFAKLWKAWRGDEELPKIDFTKEFVVVGTVGCAANRLGGNFELKENGDLKGGFFATQIAGPGFAYQILVFDRTGVKTFNGKAIEKE